MRGENEASAFWKEVEKTHNAKVTFKTYGVFLGRSGERALNLSGLLYVVGENLVFENFEKPPSLIRFFTTTEKKFQKHQLTVPLGEVLEVKEVTQAAARACINGSIDPRKTGAIGPFRRAFSRGICQVSLKTDSSLFFDLLDTRDFLSRYQKTAAPPRPLFPSNA